jgi:hypothetical protein
MYFCLCGKKESKAELVQLLNEHRQALAASCEAYDGGHEWEAARLATTTFTLVHDRGAIRSLLTQLGLKASLRFVSSGRVVSVPGMVVASTPPLLMMRFLPGHGPKCMPRLGEAHSSGLMEIQRLLRCSYLRPGCTKELKS